MSEENWGRGRSFSELGLGEDRIFASIKRTERTCTVESLRNKQA
jgi:hypothetical protein